MPTPTYTPLATVTLGASASSVTFSSIPATYRDLIVVVESKATSSGIEGQLRLNGDTSINYSWVRMTGTGIITASTSNTLSFMPLADGVKASTTEAAFTIIQLLDYAAGDKHNTILVRNNAASSGTEAFAGRRASTAAVTSVRIQTNSGSWATGGRFDLYGVIA
jgi:hypothetical protein